LSRDGAPLFDRTGWWDEDCAAFRSLRSVNRFRLRLLQQWVPNGFAGLSIVDLGCGGGLLAAPLAAAGARVVGIDTAPVALAQASARGGENFHGIVGDLTAPPLPDGCADLVLLADVIEHVAAPGAAMATAARLLRPGGSIFVNTISRTLRSRVLAIWAAEGLGYVPRGTHQWDRFVTPAELDALATEQGLARTALVGEAPQLCATLRERAIVLRPSRSTAVGYAALYRRAA